MSIFWEKSGALDCVVSSSANVGLEKVTNLLDVLVSTLHLVKSFLFLRSQLSIPSFKKYNLLSDFSSSFLYAS